MSGSTAEPVSANMDPVARHRKLGEASTRGNQWLRANHFAVLLNSGAATEPNGLNAALMQSSPLGSVSASSAY